METVINFNQLQPQTTTKQKGEGSKRRNYEVKFVRKTQGVKNPYERVQFSDKAMDKYDLWNVNGIQFYGVVEGKILIATCPEADAKKMTGTRGNKKVPYFKHSSFIDDLAEFDFIPKSEDCEIELEFTPIQVANSPDNYNFYAVTAVAEEKSDSEKAVDLLSGTQDDEKEEPEDFYKDDSELFSSREEEEEQIDQARLDF